MTQAGVYIIAEAGVNHDGDLDTALILVDEAAKAGADAVKFQTFKAESMVTAQAPKADYQKTAASGGGESQLEMLRRLELDEEQHRALVTRCKERDIDFLSAPFDMDSLRFLTDGLGLGTLKIPSGEITNGPLLLEAARRGVNIICSTGMSSLEEVEEALGVLAFGFTANHDASPHAFGDSLASEEGTQALRDRVTLLHCTSEYPAPLEDVNLRAMDTLAETFGLAVGLSDHSQGITVPIAAAARGASVIEKHFTLGRSRPGPDHKASLEPGELREMAAAIRHVEIALGDGVKQPRPSEIGTRDIARKSLVAACPISRGQTFTEETVAVKRPGGGLSPMMYWEWLGRTAERDYAKDEPVET